MNEHEIFDLIGFGKMEISFIRQESEQLNLSIKEYFRKCVLAHAYRYSMDETDLYEGKF